MRRIATLFSPPLAVLADASRQPAVEFEAERMLQLSTDNLRREPAVRRIQVWAWGGEDLGRFGRGRDWE
jgi:hypothetical protein